MDVEPLYCAEQIVVPAGLDGVLKQFVKEVVRRQPEDLVAFGAKYFADQAALQKSLGAVTPPAPAQLRAVYDCLRAGPAEAPIADVEAACAAAGIAPATLAAAVQAGSVNTARPVAVVEPLALMLAMGCPSLGATLRAAFEVFGSKAGGEDAAGGGGGGAAGSRAGSAGAGGAKVEVPLLLQLLGVLGARDAEVTPALREAAARALDGQAAVTLAALAAVPALAARLAAA